MATRASIVDAFLILVAFMGPGATQGLGRTDQRFDESLIGDWTVVSVDLAGKEGKENPPKAVIRITKDRMQLINNGETELELDCRLNRLKSPNEIDLTFELNKGNSPVKMSVKGIFRAEGGNVILCFTGDPNAERPKEFKKATKENGLMVFKLTKSPQLLKKNDKVD